MFGYDSLERPSLHSTDRVGGGLIALRPVFGDTQVFGLHSLLSKQTYINFQKNTTCILVVTVPKEKTTISSPTDMGSGVLIGLQQICGGTQLLYGFHSLQPTNNFVCCGTHQLRFPPTFGQTGEQEFATGDVMLNSSTQFRAKVPKEKITFSSDWGLGAYRLETNNLLWHTTTERFPPTFVCSV